MSKLVFLFIILASLQANGDLTDEVNTSIDNLRILVRSLVNLRSSDLENLVIDFHAYHDRMLTFARGDIEIEYLNLVAYIWMLEHQDGATSICTESFTQLVEDLHQEGLASLAECTAIADSEIDSISENSDYRLNIVMNDVEYFQYQVDRCQGDFLCISPLTSKIEEAMITYPQKVEVEMSHTNQMSEDLQIQVQDCLNLRVSHIPSAGNTIIDDAYKSCAP